MLSIGSSLLCRRWDTYGVCSWAGCCCRWTRGGGWGRSGSKVAGRRARRRCCCCRRRCPSRWRSRRSCRCCSSARSPPPLLAALDTTRLFQLTDDSLVKLNLLTSLYVVQLRLWGRIILRGRRGGFDPSPGLGGRPELWAGLVGANRLLLDPGLDLTAALGPETHTNTADGSAVSPAWLIILSETTTSTTFWWNKFYLHLFNCCFSEQTSQSYRTWEIKLPQSLFRSDLTWFSWPGCCCSASPEQIPQCRG